MTGNTTPAAQTQEQIDLAAKHLKEGTIIAKPGEKITYSPHGYVVAADGTVYSMVYQYWHGIVKACLEVKELPTNFVDVGLYDHRPDGEMLVLTEDREDMSVMKFQHYRAKGEYQSVAPASMLGIYWTMSDSVLSPECRVAMAAIFKEHDIKPADQISCNYGEMPLRVALKMSEYPGNREEGDEGPSRWDIRNKELSDEGRVRKDKRSRYDD